MTVSSIKVKIVRKATVKLRGIAKFPANVSAQNFLTITRTGSTFTFGIDYTVLTPGPILDPTTAIIAVLDQTAGIYKEVSLASMLISGLDADLQAIAALTGTGVLSRTAANTWVLRTITGTANEITLTNGDGVAGAPTVSLPASLTFTGKTITGGTFNSPALVTPALGTPASGVATNLTGTAASLTAGHVTTNANLTGDVTSVGNAATIGANKVTNAMRAQMAAFTIKGNNSGSTANEADIDITALTSKASPVSADIVLIQDSAASNAFKRTTVGALASAGSVASFNTLTGAIATSVVVQKFTASGTYTPTAGMLHAIIECIGGGGGGGGATSTATGTSSGGGGGAGSRSVSYVTAATVGASQTVTIGAAGTAGTAGNNAGGAGGDTSVGTLCVGKGGTGGSGAATAASGAGGLGGVAGTGDITGTGMPGGVGNGANVAGQYFMGGFGGSTMQGGGAVSVTGAGAATAGNAATGPGGGGGGAGINGTASNAAGGVGFRGQVNITEFVNL